MNKVKSYMLAPKGEEVNRPELWLKRLGLEYENIDKKIKNGVDCGDVVRDSKVNSGVCEEPGSACDSCDLKYKNIEKWWSQYRPTTNLPWLN